MPLVNVNGKEVSMTDTAYRNLSAAASKARGLQGDAQKAALKEYDKLEKKALTPEPEKAAKKK